MQAEFAKGNFDTPMARRKASFASSDEVWKYIDELKISNVNLSVPDIETILETIIYDGRVEKNVILVKQGTEHTTLNTYRAISSSIQGTGLTRTPCGVCPVMKDCREGNNNDISPSNCIYITEWFDY